jgi:BsaWI restriction endonuclease type 2
MAKIECRSVQSGVRSVFIEIENITDAEVKKARERLDWYIANGGGQVSTAVANAFLEVAKACPKANPSDLWHHVIYGHLLNQKWSDARWKRVSGFALERAFVSLYGLRLAPHDIRMRILPAGEANAVLTKLGIKGTKSTKVDLFIEGKFKGEWLVFGSAHVKSSIAERVQDDVPASLDFMRQGLLSILITMDAKSFPPPHGTGINYGELGGRTMATDKDKERLKRGYIETKGQFDALFSFNLRTPPSPEKTLSGKRIYTMSLHDKQPDAMVKAIVNNWKSHKAGIKI